MNWDEEVRPIIKKALVKLRQFPRDASLEEVCDKIGELASLGQLFYKEVKPPFNKPQLG